MIRNIIILLAITLCAKARIVKRQAGNDLLCCRCVDSRTGCGDNEVSQSLNGLTCQNEFDCFIATGAFQTCEGCDFGGNSIPSSSASVQECPSGFVSCCSQADRGLVSEVSVRIGLATGNDPLGENINGKSVDPGRTICKNDKLRAIGSKCGQRDSRVYKHVDRPETHTNPGEWPWTVMLLEEGGKYAGAGAFVAKDTVITVAHKVQRFVNNPGAITVRLGDWKPNEKAPEEIYDYEEYQADCIRIHPQADLGDTLANNVAVIKFKRNAALTKNTVKGVIDLRNSNSDPPAFNAVCLPEISNQFSDRTGRCWVAAWGSNLERQREIDLPLISRSECMSRLRPTFNERGVPDWEPQPSEICAGGEVGKDTCQGEGGAPLVCLDDSKDQYFAVGLVNYGFSCNSTLPAVYTNLMDPSVNSFIQSGTRDDFC